MEVLFLSFSYSTCQVLMDIFIHFLPCFPYGVSVRLELSPAAFGREVGVIPGQVAGYLQGCMHKQTAIHTHIQKSKPPPH